MPSLSKPDFIEYLEQHRVFVRGAFVAVYPRAAFKPEWYIGEIHGLRKPLGIFSFESFHPGNETENARISDALAQAGWDAGKIADFKTSVRRRIEGLAAGAQRMPEDSYELTDRQKIYRRIGAEIYGISPETEMLIAQHFGDADKEFQIFIDPEAVEVKEFDHIPHVAGLGIYYGLHHSASSALQHSPFGLSGTAAHEAAHGLSFQSGVDEGDFAEMMMEEDVLVQPKLFISIIPRRDWLHISLQFHKTQYVFFPSPVLGSIRWNLHDPLHEAIENWWFEWDYRYVNNKIRPIYHRWRAADSNDWLSDEDKNFIAKWQSLAEQLPQALPFFNDTQPGDFHYGIAILHHMMERAGSLHEVIFSKKTERLAMLVAYMREFSTPDQYLNADAPIIHMYSRIMPAVTAFYTDFYLEMIQHERDKYLHDLPWEVVIPAPTLDYPIQERDIRRDYTSRYTKPLSPTGAVVDLFRELYMDEQMQAVLHTLLYVIYASELPAYLAIPAVALIVGWGTSRFRESGKAMHEEWRLKEEAAFAPMFESYAAQQRVCEKNAINDLERSL